MAIQKKICMLGSFGVGKTSLVSQLVHSIFSEEYLTTIGVKIDKKDVSVDDVDLTLILWDLAGEDHFEHLKTTYLQGASAFILVVDGCRMDTLRVAQNIVETNSSLSGLPFICAINKSDLKADWEITNETIDDLKANGWDLKLTSAKSKDSTEELFIHLAKKIIKSSS